MRRAVWIFNHYAVTPDMPGGTRHYNLARSLIQHGYDVTIFATSFLHWGHREMRLQAGQSWKVEEVDGVKFFWLKTFPYLRNDWRRATNMASYMVAGYRYGRRVPQLDVSIIRPDVVIGSTPHPLAVLSAYWLAKHYRAHFIAEVRDLWPQTPVDMGKLSAKSPVARGLRGLEKFLYTRAEKIISPLPNAASYITTLGIPESKVVCIPNGVDVSHVNTCRDRAGSSGQFVVMYTGAHGEANALDTILHAAKIIQDRGLTAVRFTLVGDGAEKNNLIKLRNELSLENLEFRDAVPQADIPTVLNDADVLLATLMNLPVFQYGTSPNKISSYMAAGKPILLSDSLSSDATEEANCALTFASENPQALADGVIRLWEMDGGQRKAMGKRGRRYVSDHYDWHLLGERLYDCLESLA